MNNLRLTFSAVLFLMVGAVMAQDYQIDGTYSKEGAVVYLANQQAARGAQPDSAVVRNGRFSFKGNADGKVFAKIINKNGYPSGLTLLLDGPMTVDLDTYKVSGSEENNLLNKYMLELLGPNQGISDLQERASKMSREELEKGREQLERDYDSLMTAGLAIMEKAVEENQSYIFPAWFLYKNYFYFDRAKLIAYADNGAAYMKTPLLEPITKNIDGWRRSLPGKAFTDIEEPDPNGEMHKLSEYVGNGNYVLIDFWASWCGPCMREMPNVKALYEKYHAKGFDIVGLSFDRDKKAWLGAIDRMKLPWHHLSDLAFWNTKAAKTYGVMSIPFTLLVGPDGTIVAANLTGEDLAAKLSELYDK